MDPTTPVTPPNEQPNNPEPIPQPSPQPIPQASRENFSDIRPVSNQPITIQPTAPISPAAPTPTVTPIEPSLPPAPAVINPTIDPSAAPFAPAAPAAPTSTQPSSPSMAASFQPDGPANGQPMVDGVAGQVPQAGYNPSTKRSKPRWILPVAVVAVLIVLGGGYAFGYYLPNQPSAVFSKSLQNTGVAIDRLVGFSKTSANYTSVNLASKVNIKSSGVSGDVMLTGAYDKDGNGNLKIDADIVGEKINAEVRSIKKAGNDNPDLYVQVSGIKSALDSEGLNEYDNLDGQWISIDHTLLDTYTSALEGETGTSGANQMPTTAEINDVVARIQTVNKQYLFSTDKDKAVLVNQKFIGKETMDGRKVDHFQTGYNKDHLSAYVTAIKSAVDASSLPSSYKKMYGSAFTSAAEDAKKSDGKYTFDLYADTSSKLVHAISFGDTTDKTSKVTFSQSYTSGDDYPFALSAISKDDGQTQSLKLGVTFNSKTNKVHATLDADIDGTSANGTFDVSPSTSPVTVTAPSSSKSVNDILSQLGLGGLSDPSALTDSSDTSSDLFTLTQ